MRKRIALAGLAVAAIAVGLVTVAAAQPTTIAGQGTKAADKAGPVFTGKVLKLQLRKEGGAAEVETLLLRDPQVQRMADREFVVGFELDDSAFDRGKPVRRWVAVADITSVAEYEDREHYMLNEQVKRFERIRREREEEKQKKMMKAS